MKDDDDIWMKPPVNYTPYFKWLIKRRQQLREELIDECIKTEEACTTNAWHERYGIGDRRPDRESSNRFCSFKWIPLSLKKKMLF